MDIGVLVQELLELSGGGIASRNGEQFRGDIQGCEIARDVGSASGHEILLLKIHDGNRRFG